MKNRYAALSKKFEKVLLVEGLERGGSVGGAPRAARRAPAGAAWLGARAAGEATCMAAIAQRQRPSLKARQPMCMLARARCAQGESDCSDGGSSLAGPTSAGDLDKINRWGSGKAGGGGLRGQQQCRELAALQALAGRARAPAAAGATRWCR